MYVAMNSERVRELREEKARLADAYTYHQTEQFVPEGLRDK